MNENNLAEALRRRDEAAIALVMERYTSLLRGAASSALGRVAAAGDLDVLVADVFV